MTDDAIKEAARRLAAIDSHLKMVADLERQIMNLKRAVEIERAAIDSLRKKTQP